MNAKRKLVAALGLAARHRQYQIDAETPELARRGEDERAALEMAERARGVADDAARAQGTALGRGSVSVDVLHRHMAYAHHSRARFLVAEEDAREASAQAEALRSSVRTLLFERDACEQRQGELESEQRTEAGRALARQVDETWLLRRRSQRARKGP